MNFLLRRQKDDNRIEDNLNFIKKIGLAFQYALINLIENNCKSLLRADFAMVALKRGDMILAASPLITPEVSK
jgi:hypothetical protein